MAFGYEKYETVGYGSEFCPCTFTGDDPSEYCLDGCYFDAARLRDQNHGHIKDEDGKGRFCVCDGHWSLINNKPKSVTPSGVEIYVVDNT